jgi:hypothetical protein
MFSNFGLKYSLSDISITTLSVFQFPLACYITSYPFTFSQCVSLSMKCVSRDQQTSRSSLLIQSLSLHLLIRIKAIYF